MSYCYCASYCTLKQFSSLIIIHMNHSHVTCIAYIMLNPDRVKKSDRTDLTIDHIGYFNFLCNKAKWWLTGSRRRSPFPLRYSHQARCQRSWSRDFSSFWNSELCDLTCGCFHRWICYGFRSFKRQGFPTVSFQLHGTPKGAGLIATLGQSVRAVAFEGE